MSCLEIGAIHIDHVDVLNITSDCSEEDIEVAKVEKDVKSEETTVEVPEDKGKSK